MCVVYTSRIGYGGSDRIDTTAKSSAGLGKLLAPTWGLVGGVKHHETGGRDARWLKYVPLTQPQYVDAYYDLIRERYRADQRIFIAMLACERVSLLCYCAAGVFCHRHIAVDILERIAWSKGLSFVRGGEMLVR